MNQTTNKTQTTGSSVRTRHMVQTAIFGVIIVIMAFTPFLGYIPLGFTRATIIHIPVILASLLMGPKTGALLGLLFGLTSFINNTVNPTVTSFVFTPFYSIQRRDRQRDHLFCSAYSDRSRSALYLQIGEKMQQINRCFQNRTDFGGSRRFTDKYIVGYEFDLSVF